jgi:hypothetical protein
VDVLGELLAFIDLVVASVDIVLALIIAIVPILLISLLSLVSFRSLRRSVFATEIIVSGAMVPALRACS